MKQTADLLISHGIRPSQQRITVLHYLQGVHTHPTVDTIYQDLLPSNPGLSRTTVYNTLQILSDNGLVMTLDFGEGFLRYDADVHPHCHFKCKCCGRVFDIMKPPPDCSTMLPKGFKLEGAQLKLFGVCDQCSKNG